MGSFIRHVPLIGVLAVIYLIVAEIFEGVLDKKLFEFALPSGHAWAFYVREIFLFFGLVLLYVEILKSTKSTRGQIVEHMTSMVAFVGCLLLFLLVPKTGSTTFLLITMMEALDVTAGFTVSIIAARRDMEVDRVSAA